MFLNLVYTTDDSADDNLIYIFTVSSSSMQGSELAVTTVCLSQLRPSSQTLSREAYYHISYLLWCPQAV